MKVGDEVVCIKTHSKGVVVKGKIYTIKDKLICSCGFTTFNVGIPAGSGFCKCHCCDATRYGQTAWWIHASLFAPLQTNTVSAELAKEAMKEERNPIKKEEYEQV